MPSTTHALLPEAISSLLSSSPNLSSTSSATLTDPIILKAQLKRVSRSTWLRLGSECHNAGFATDAAAALKSHKPATSSVSMFSTAATAARAAALLYDNGIPRILGTIERRRAGSSEPTKSIEESDEQEQGLPTLWSLYRFYRQHFASQGDLQNWSNRARRSSSITHSTFLSIEQQPWQLEFLKSACPEIVVIAFVDTFLEYGPNHGFERDLPTDLVETLDFEWRSNSGPAKRAVLALIQTLIACRRYAKNINSSSGDTKHAVAKGLGLGLVNSTADSIKPATNEMSYEQRSEQEHEMECHRLALIMAEACTALEVFFETERGRNLPKLITLYQQELAADAKLQSRSGQAGSGAERGIKRHGAGAVGAGSGILGSAGIDPMDTVARKKFKSGGSEAILLGSTSSTIATSPPLAPPLTPTATPTATSSMSNPVNSAAFKSSSQFVDQALTGYSSAAVAQPALASASTLSSASAQQQAKLSNPLWSPIMGITHLPQWPTKYAAQVESELERWISLLGHMDGAVFSEKLVGLIKSVYPSDQKFLLDQILIDYMCWEGNGGREREAEEPAFIAATYLKEAIPSLVPVSSSNAVVASGAVGAGMSKLEIKTGDWVMETIMSTLVSLVIKPEESSTYLEPGSKKWTEIIEIPNEVEGDMNGNPSAYTTSLTSSTTTAKALVAGSGDTPSSLVTTPVSAAAAATPSFRPSAALGGAKKRRVRNLYNRRVSPFYAVLAMFQPKRAVGRVTGMLYSSSEELASHYEAASATAGPSLMGIGGVGGGPPEPGAGGVIGVDAQELLKQVRDTPTFPKATTITSELEEPEPDVAKMDRRRAKKQKRREKKKQQLLFQRKPGSGGDAAMDTEEGANQKMDLEADKKMDIDEQVADEEEKRLKADGESADTADKNDGGNTEQDPSTKGDDEDDETSQMEGLDQGATVDGHLSRHEPESAQQDEWGGEVAEEDALELAKRVEASRIVCQAPFKVLMFILQYLTRANQAGALDSWITDALSATIPALQEQYFEWMLCNMITASMASIPSLHPAASSTTLSGAEVNQDQGETVVFEEELLRLLAVLVAAQGIGYEPAKMALETVERVYQNISESLKIDHKIQDSPYWTRAKTLLDHH
ncbi:hypothetical protein BGX27_005724 [Mortierella sp. AM989]|nr:hypothetical protein BGX27_005724 [Mortierella sp. AM989]